MINVDPGAKDGSETTEAVLLDAEGKILARFPVDNVTVYGNRRTTCEACGSLGLEKEKT